MKKVINGKLYNTETAQYLGDFSNGYPSDLDYISEELYKTRSGNYFIHGEGGANSRYSKSIGNNSWSGSEEIIPVDLPTAKEWAEKNLSGDDYLKFFTVEDETILNVELSAEARTKLDEIKSSTGKSYREIIEALILQ